MLGALFVVVSGVWWIGRRLTGHRHPGSVAGMAAAGFLAAVAVATLGSDAPGRSLGELARMVTAVLMFFIVDRLCETTGRPDRFVVAVLAAAVVPVTVALVGPLAGLHRVEIKDRIERIVSTFAQSNPLGHFLTIVLLVLVAYVLLRPGQPRVLAVIAMAPVGLTLALTYTRLAWAAAVGWGPGHAVGRRKAPAGAGIDRRPRRAWRPSRPAWGIASTSSPRRTRQ